MGNDTKLRIALVVNSAWNVANFRLGLCKALRDNGHEVLIITPPDALQQEFVRKGFEVASTNHLSRKSRNPIQDLLLLWQLRNIYRAEEIDAVLHYTIKPVIYGTLATIGTGVKVINTITGLGYAFLSKGITNKVALLLYRLSLRHASINLFQNKDDQLLFQQLSLLGGSATKIVHGSGVDIARFDPQPYDKARKRRFLFVGRLLRDKGVYELMEAIQRIVRTNEDLTFDIVGGLDEHNPTSFTSQEIQQWSGIREVTFHGQVKDVKPFYERCGIVILPSYREGLPRVLLEAAASARPIIATDVPGCREIAIPGRNAWLVPPRSAADLAQAIQAVLDSSDEKLIALGSAGRQLVEEKFAESQIIATYLTHLRELE